MNQKILKTQLVSLFIITLLAFISFLYSASLPDNLFSVSSSGSINFFSYYLSSFLAFFDFFIGPWIFVPFFCFSIIYAFLYSKREIFLDSFNVLALVTFCIGLFSMAYPQIVGPGLLELVNTTFKLDMQIILTVISFFAFIGLSFRGKTLELLNGTYNLSKKVPAIAGGTYEKLNFIPKAKAIVQKSEQLKDKIQVSLPKVLKGPKFKKIEAPKTNEEQSFTPIIRPENANDEELAEAFNDKLPEHKIEVITDIEESTNKMSERSAQVFMKKKSNPLKDMDYFDSVENVKLSNKKFTGSNPDSKYFQDIMTKIEDKLAEFKLEAQVINILKGPVVDTFELELGQGIKVSKIANLSEDISLALYGAPIRVVHPLKGRNTIGIEVPRSPREIIFLEEVVTSSEFKSSDKKLPIAMGKDAFGEIFVVDLASMPHMLVAGATGSGKSVFINTLLVSLLIKKSPRQMKLVLIDPKQLELALYSKLPHLVMPIITDAKVASVALTWCVQEMEKRYSILKEMGVRNIEGFNKKVKKANPEELARIHHFYEEADEYELPYVVVVVDEFGDLILTKAGKEIENNICRLAAKARAAGIHLVLATQRPSVDVITGLIKSNFPTRVSFRVTTNIDSRTILNQGGAEQLLGKGDMLYKHGVETIRSHASLVDETEIEVLTNSINSSEQKFDESVINFLENGGPEESDPYAFGSHIASSTDNNSTDELYEEAVKIVCELRGASASMLQRRLKIGYNRAANLVEEMEKNGIVGPSQGAKPRKVLV